MKDGRPAPMLYLSLQLGRAIGALMALGYHAAGSIGSYFGYRAIEPLFLFMGHPPLYYFFVLSGFIITHVHWNDLNRPSRFTLYLKRRMVRMLPAYWIILISVALVAYAYPPTRASIPTDPWVILKSLLLIPQNAASIGGLGAPVLVVTWSLQYEVVFYLAFAVFIFSWRLGAALLALALALWAGGWLAGYPVPWGFLRFEFLLLFPLGVLVAYLVPRYQPARPMRFFRIGITLFVGGIVAETLWTGAEPLLPHLGRVALYGLSSALLMFGLLQAEASGELNIRTPHAALSGDVSYVLYLMHFPIVSVLCKLLVGLGWSGPLGGIAAFLLICAVCIVASIAFHLWVERPILAWLKRRVLDPARAAAQ